VMLDLLPLAKGLLALLLPVPLMPAAGGGVSFRT
jgi:hypothetical protein